jgi:hypothetical protein
MPAWLRAGGLALGITPILVICLIGCSNGGGGALSTATVSSFGQGSCRSPGRGGGATPENLLSCKQLAQPPYWLGGVLKVPGLPDVELNGSYTTNDERPISALTNLVLDYGPGQVPKITLTEWNRATWQDSVSRFTSYDPATVPIGGPVNWWQHPCVEEDLYRANNGAEVHLFRAHLDSIIRILPMSPAEVAACRSKPVGVIGGHVYFDKTVVQLEVGTEPGNEYDAEETVRYLASSLRPYQAP